MEKLICEVCGKNEAVGVACVPMVPMSCAYCSECLRVNAHPWGVLVANTICIGGLDQANEEWKQMVQDTCTHLGRTLEQFNLAVEQGIKEMDALCEEHDKALDEGFEEPSGQ